MKKTQLVTCALAMFAGSGCATNIRDQVSSAFATAPDWFNARAEEVKGEGYPDLRDAPGPPLVDTEDESWSVEVEKLNAAAEAMQSDPKAELADPQSREDPALWAKRMRERVNEGVVSAPAPPEEEDGASLLE